MNMTTYSSDGFLTARKISEVCHDCPRFMRSKSGTVLCLEDKDTKSTHSGWRHFEYWPDDFAGTLIPPDCVRMDVYKNIEKLRGL